MLIRSCVPGRPLQQAHARGGTLTRITGCLLGLGFRVMCGVSHRDVGDDAFCTVPVLGDHVVRKPYARLLLDGVYRNGERIDAVIQIVACKKALGFGRQRLAHPAM